MPEINLAGGQAAGLQVARRPARHDREDDIVNAARGRRACRRRVDLPDIDLSKIELPKQITDRLPSRHRAEPAPPDRRLRGHRCRDRRGLVADHLAASTGPRVRRAVDDLKARMNGEPNDLSATTTRRTSAASLGQTRRTAAATPMTSEPYASANGMPISATASRSGRARCPRAPAPLTLDLPDVRRAGSCRRGASSVPRRAEYRRVVDGSRVNSDNVHSGLQRTSSAAPRGRPAPEISMTATRELVTDRREEYAFHDDIVYLAETKRGLTRETVEEISGFKDEPDWMLQFRLRAYDHFVKRPMPTWTDGLDRIDFDKIVYYRKPSEREEKSWDDVPDQIKATFERLGIPEAERKFLAGVGAQYDSEVVYHSVSEELTKIGVVFMGMDQALKDHEDIVRKYFATVVPAEDNKFSALNTAVWSGGSFVYVPKGVEVPLPLQAYFRINGENTGQFERTLIVVEEGAKVHYIEGCTAPIYATDSLHAAVVEVVALPGSKVRYTTIQNWSNDVYNLVTKRAHAYENSTVEWIDANTGSRKTVKFPSIYLRGENATADIISVAVAGKGQHQDTGAKAIHLAPNTKSPDRVEVRVEGRRPGDVPRPAQGVAGRDERRRQRPLRRADARRRSAAATRTPTSTSRKTTRR